MKLKFIAAIKVIHSFSTQCSCFDSKKRCVNSPANQAAPASNAQSLLDNFLIQEAILYILPLGTGQATKTDEFSEKIQTAFDTPPPHFRKTMLHFFGSRPQIALYKGPKSATQIFGLKIPPPLFRKFIRFGSLTRLLHIHHTHLCRENLISIWKNIFRLYIYYCNQAK